MMIWVYLGHRVNVARMLQTSTVERETSPLELLFVSLLLHDTWRIIPVRKWLVTPIYKPFKPFITRPTLTKHGS